MGFRGEKAFSLNQKTTLILNCANAEAVSQLSQDDGWDCIGKLAFSGASLAGIIELARMAVNDGPFAHESASKSLRDVREVRRLFDEACILFDGRCPSDRSEEALFAAPEIELWMIRSAACVESSGFQLFMQRFHRSLKGAGFGARFPHLLTQAFLEMAENIVRHSAANEETACGVVGFHVLPQQMNYIAADLGRGVLASLRENPRWRDLSDEGNALVAAAKKGATRIPQHEEGDGFRLAFQAFLDREGVFLMRSGDGLARIHGNLSGREAEIGNAAGVPGLRIAALCNLDGLPTEIEFNS